MSYIPYTFRFLFAWKKSVKFTKIEAVNKGIGSARIPRNQAPKICLVPNRKRIFNEAMRRTDLAPIGYGHLLN